METGKRPNILILYTDQQRLDSLKCYGSSFAVSPNIDRLASEGARIDRFFVQNPVCMPSRMSFLTGRYCSSLGVGTNGVTFPEKDAVPLPLILQAYGYKTAQIGKLHFRQNETRNHRDPYPYYKEYGFDVFISSEAPDCDDTYLKWLQINHPDKAEKVIEANDKGMSEYYVYRKNKKNADKPLEKRSIEVWQAKIFEEDESLTHSSYVASQTINFIENHDSNQPFFAIAGFYAPHAIINPPEKFVNMLKPENMELPRVGKDEEESSFNWQQSDEGWKKIRAYYYALCAHVDNCVGKILETLERSGKAVDTIVVFTSDHGEYLGDHGNVGKGMPGHDCITNVPYILRYPKGIQAGTSFGQLVEGVDFVPTILDFCSIPIPDAVQGKSLKPLLDGRVNQHKNDILVEEFNDKGKRSTTVRTDRYKYNLTNQGAEILYDLEDDPYELVNVASEESYAKVLSDMRKRLALRMGNAAAGRKQIARY